MARVPEVFQKALDRRLLEPTLPPLPNWSPNLNLHQVPSEQLRAESEQLQTVHKRLSNLISSREGNPQYRKEKKAWEVSFAFDHDDGHNEGVTTYTYAFVPEAIVEHVKGKLEKAKREIDIYIAQGS